MRSWLFLLGGLIVWAVHFLGVYGLASLGAVIGDAGDPWALASVVGLTLACAAVDGVLAAVALRRLRARMDPLDRFIAGGAAFAAGLSLLAVLWQGLPVLVEG